MLWACRKQRRCYVAIKVGIGSLGLAGALRCDLSSTTDKVGGSGWLTTAWCWDAVLCDCAALVGRANRPCVAYHDRYKREPFSSHSSAGVATARVATAAATMHLMKMFMKLRRMNEMESRACDVRYRKEWVRVGTRLGNGTAGGFFLPEEGQFGGVARLVARGCVAVQ